MALFLHIRMSSNILALFCLPHKPLFSWMARPAAQLGMSRKTLESRSRGFFVRSKKSVESNGSGSKKGTLNTKRHGF